MKTLIILITLSLAGYGYIYHSIDTKISAYGKKHQEELELASQL